MSPKDLGRLGKANVSEAMIAITPTSPAIFAHN